MRPTPEHLLDLREYPVLLVDDEPENLRMFERGLGREFDVLTASSGEEALRVVGERPIAVVLSDQRMHGMTGVELLSRIRTLDPKTIRILVTAYGDAETLTDAINDGSVYRYIPKPWTPSELHLAVRRAVEVYALDRERDELVKELSLLNWVSKVISQELELDALLDLLLDTVTDELGFEAATLLLADEVGASLVCARTTADVGDPAALGLPASEAPELFRRLRAGEARALARSATPGEAVSAFLKATGAEQMLVVPLLNKGGLLGALAVHGRPGGGFSAGDHTLLEGIASQAAIAVGNARLVEDLRRSRQQVLRAERLGTLGTLAAGLAHEINNPLVSLHTFLSLAPGKRQEEDGEFWREYHELTCSELARIRGLVATMARLGRGAAEPVPHAPCQVVELAGEVATLLSREAQAGGVELSVDADPATPVVQAGREQLQQVVLNLTLNALHATPRGGCVDLRIRPGPRSGACIEVVDTGSGVPAEDLERIFDPFFTTKDPDQGTGLGLMISHGIVADHGGTIEVESREGSGTTFRVHLPSDGAKEARG
jgi:signal transduction histidine kinase/DNA-binding NarL/FixJ family response regulator